jgi:hypothetical protein
MTELLRLRRSSPLFRLRTAADVAARVKFHNDQVRERGTVRDTVRETAREAARDTVRGTVGETARGRCECETR